MRLIILTFLIWNACSICLRVLADAEPQPKTGKKSFGVGMLAGGLAGMFAGHTLANHHNKHVSSLPQQQETTITTIKQSEPLNGCYKQTIRQPDPADSSKFIETEQLICPPTPPAVPNLQIPSPIVPPSPVLIPAQVVAPVLNASNSSVFQHPVTVAPPNGAAYVEVQMPRPPVAAPAPAPAQVYVISQKKGHYSSRAAPQVQPRWILSLLLMLTCGLRA